MNRAHGFIVESGPLGSVEYESFTCFHCQAIVKVPHRAKGEDIGGLCKVCMRLICRECVGVGSCTPWQKQMEQSEARDRLLQAVGL
jgi:hypothetical protein